MESPAAEDSNPSVGRGMIWKVYLAIGLATWGDNMWEFAGGLFMMKLHPGSLRLIAVYGLVLSTADIVLGSLLGRWIDKSKRLTAARICLLVQNCSVSLCAMVLSLYLALVDGQDHWKWITIGGVIFLSMMARLASRGTNIVMEKDWMVVIADGDKDLLAEMNAVTRTIGLTTFILAPALVGQLFSFLGYVITGIFVASWNVTSMMIEYGLLEWIYRSFPALQSKRCTAEDINDPQEVDELVTAAAVEDTKLDGLINMVLTGWRLYFNHPVRNAGIGLALLYMTVLGFDNITYGFVLTQGIPESVLGVLVALSALLGVLGSAAYPFIRKLVGLERTGLFGMCFQVFTSSLAVVSVFAPGSPFLNTRADFNATLDHLEEPTQSNSDSVVILLAGITVARFGLYMTDLTVTQILQERVEEENRGVINGVQTSLNSLLDLIKCILVILLPFAWQFGFLIIFSFASISLGWLFYALYSRSVRGHLFHFEKICIHQQNQLPSGLAAA